MPEKATQVMTYTAFLRLKEESKAGQHPGFLRQGVGILWQLFLLLSCYEELPLDWLLFIVGNSPSPQAPFPLFPFCAVLGLFVLRSFFLHFRGLTLQAAFCGRQEGQREGETGMFLPLSLSGSSSGNLHGPSPGQTPVTPTGTGWPCLLLQ